MAAHTEHRGAGSEGVSVPCRSTGSDVDVESVLTCIPYAGLLVNAFGKIMAVNSSANRLLGYEHDELTEQPLEAIIPPQHRKAHAAGWSDFIAHPKPRSVGVGLGLQALRKDGQEIPVEIGLRPLVTQAGLLIVAWMREISQPEEWYRKIFEQLAIGVVHSDSEGAILNVNRKFCELSGYTRAEMLTLNIQALTHPDDIDKSLAARAYMLAGVRSDYERELRLIPKSGAPLWTRITTSLVPHAHSELGHFISFIQDISSQRRVEEEMQEMALRFHQVTDNIREVFWLNNPLNSEILFISPAFEAIWGRSCRELKSEPRLWLEAIHPEDRERVREAVRTKQINGQYDEEYRIVRPDGSIRWIRDRAFPVRADDFDVIRIAGVAEDITERKATTDELKESERRFSEILGKVRLASLMLDRDGNLIYCNDHLLAISGWTREEVLGRNWFETFVPASKAHANRDLFASLLSEPSSYWHGESEILTRSAGERLLRWNCIVLRSPSGQPIGMASLGEDVTDRKRDEAMRARMAAIVESTNDAIVGKSLDGTITDWNAAAERLFGYPAEEVVGRSITRIIPAGRDPEEQEILRRVSDGERVTDFETVRLRKDGSLVDVSLTVSPIYDAAGRIIGASKIARDITERKRADLKIRQLNRVYAVLSGINGLIVRVREKAELFREACRIAIELGNFRAAWLGLVDPFAMHVEVVARSGIDEEYIQHLPLGLSDADAREYGLPGRVVKECKPIVSNDMEADPRFVMQQQARARGIKSAVCMPLLVGSHVIGVYTLYAGEKNYFDADELTLLEELAGDIAFALDHIDKAHEVNYLAYYDPLTGLANRTLFIERLNQSLHAARPGGQRITVVLVDVERLRTINDSFGRHAGDTLLKVLAARWRRMADGVQLARFSGDVFAVVLEGLAGRAEAELALQQCWQRGFAESITIGHAEIRVSGKAGIATFPDDGTDAELLISKAEAALRAAKQTGERFVFHTAEIGARSAETLSMETRLSRALERDELVLHYQPKIDLQTRRITGVEALLRWQSPDFGLVPPMKFIPVLEETGMILEAGRWALSRAVADQRRWADLGTPVKRIAVNVSSIQLRQRDFVATVASALTGGAQPPAIDLEITESLLVEDIEDNVRKLKEVRALGLSIAIDDFGTGYSSLSYLARLPVQAVKIDRSFIISMLDDPDTMTLVQTIISLAHSLRLKVIAEGVDAEEQAKLLRLLRCDEMQGFLFSRPRTFEAMSTLLQGERAGRVTD